MINSRKQKANEAKVKAVLELEGLDAIGYGALLSL